MTAADIVKQVKAALKEFGRYSFEDKGPREVMDLDPILEHVQTLQPADARDLLIAVAANKERCCASLVETLLVELQDQPDDWWGVLMESEVLSDMF